ncbi:MAG: phosphopantetheine-protein transferase, partial [bacterium]
MAKDSWPLPPQEISLSKNYVHVWSILLDQTSETTASLRQILSLEEQSRADKFYFEHDRNRFTVARAILRTILGNYLGHNPSDIKFSYAKNGKPFLENIDLQFNVSHSQDLALCAFTYQRELGVDVEYLRLMKDAEQIAKRFFSPRESSLFCSLPPQEQQLAFFRCWTRKEAYIKAIGDGLSYPLDKF